MVVNKILKRRRQNTLAQLIVAKNTNIELIKRYEEKKLEEHKCEQKIIDKCAEMSTHLQQRMDELIANGSVAATSKKTEKMLERAHQWSQEMTDRLASILCLQESPEQSRASLTMPAATNNNNMTLLDTTIARRQATTAQLQLAGLSASFYVQQGRKSLSVSMQKSPRTRHLQKNKYDHNKSMIDEHDIQANEDVSQMATDETNNNGEEEDTTMAPESDRTPTPTPPPPLPDFYVVEDGLNYTKKGEKKHLTVQNRYGQFKLVRISGVTEPFQCKARVMNLPPHSQMPLSIAFLPTIKQRGVNFSSMITLRTSSDDGQDDIYLQRPLTGQWS